MSSKSSSQQDDVEKKDGPGASWKQNEEHILPKNRLGVVSCSLVCTMFLAILDHTIIATVLPRIVADLKCGRNYNWIANAYVLGAGAFGPLYGRLSDIFGRKPLLYSSIVAFLVGSALCGAAKNVTWLLVSRTLQGVGAGGALQLPLIIISDIVPLKDRARYGGLFGLTYGLASVTGPLVGGILADTASWRWCFFINLPIGGLAVTLLFFFLNVHPPEKRPFCEQIAELDFIGLSSLVLGITFLLIGFSFGELSWSEPTTVISLVTGSVLLLVGGVYEATVKRASILPARLFKTRTTGCLLIIAFFQSAVFMPEVFYLPLFYQVLGSSAIGAGVRMLPYTLAASSLSVVAGFVVSKSGRNRPTIWFGSAFLTLGSGLMITLDHVSSISKQELFPVVAATGIAFLSQTPLVALQAAMPLKDMATATSGFMFLRSLGGAVGLAIGQAILATFLPQTLAAIPNIDRAGLGSNMGDLNDNIGRVHLIPDATLRNAVLHAWARSIAMVWMATTLWAGIALILSLFLREYSVDRKTLYSDDPTNANDTRESSQVV